jgi:magnesium chelatase family protein
MMAKALPGVLPPLMPDEAIEITRIYSAAGQLQPGQGLVTSRPVRSPHHTASAAAIVGGGIVPRPGEISLAHRGVLFLDELAEFPRDVLEGLRQPMEDHIVTIARSHSAVRFPANFMLIAAMNPTPKGDLPPGEVGKRQMERYMERLSGPLLDRIDIHIEVPTVRYKEMRADSVTETSAEIRARVEAAREIQKGRGFYNAQLPTRPLRKYCPLDEAGERTLEMAVQRMGLSARAHDRVLKLARTIADLDHAEAITAKHLAEAVQYRSLDRSYWN